MELTRAVGRISSASARAKLSMERLAAEAGVSRSMLGQIERGRPTPLWGCWASWPGH
ncbi:MAG: helix-turn-helix transcriptional regulator [Dysosmobacter welbionis]